MSLKKKGTAPKVSLEEVNAAMKKVEYTLLQDGRTTIALVTLDNGFTVRGESACVSKENYDPVLGQAIALEDAQSRVWGYLGFRLADRLHQAKLKKGKGVKFRDSGSGAYVTKEFAKLNPKTTVQET